MPKRQPWSAVPTKPPLVVLNLAKLRERRTTLRSEIDALMQRGTELITRCRLWPSCNGIVRDPTGEPKPCEHKKVTRPRGLRVEDREAIAARRREIEDIEDTFQAFGR